MRGYEHPRSTHTRLGKNARTEHAIRSRAPGSGCDRHGYAARARQSTGRAAVARIPHSRAQVARDLNRRVILPRLDQVAIRRIPFGDDNNYKDLVETDPFK